MGWSMRGHCMAARGTRGRGTREMAQWEPCCPVWPESWWTSTSAGAWSGTMESWQGHFFKYFLQQMSTLSWPIILLLIVLKSDDLDCCPGMLVLVNTVRVQETLWPRTDLEELWVYPGSIGSCRGYRMAGDHVSSFHMGPTLCKDRQ